MIGRKILRVFLMMAMVIGLLPGMGVIVHATDIDILPGSEAGKVNAEGNTYTATAKSGYVFYNWTVYLVGVVEPIESTENPFTLTLPDGSEIDHMQAQFVEKVNVSNVTLNKDSADLTVGGETLTLTAKVTPEFGTDKTVTWTSNAPDVATVANGVVTAVAAGTATITATATNGTETTEDDKTARCAVTVNPKPTYAITVASGITGGSVVSDKATASAGDTVTLTATPNANYGLNTLTVTKASGGTVDVTQDASDTSKYTFTMPGEAVTVAAEFKEIPAVPTNVAWNGKTVSWNAVEGATGYEYKWNVGTVESGTGVVDTGTSVDLSDIVKRIVSDATSFQATFSVSVCAKNGNVKSACSAVSEKQFNKVTLQVNTVKVGGRSGSGGGNVTVPSDFENTVENPDTYVGVVGTNDTVTFTATENTGYEFAGYYVDQTTKTDKTLNYIVSNPCNIIATFQQVRMPVNVRLVIGSGHGAYADTLLQYLKGREEKYYFHEQFTLSGDKTEINLVISNIDSNGDPTKIGALQYDLDTDAQNAAALFGTSSEEFISYSVVAQKNSLDNYTDEWADIRESEEEMKNQKPITSDKKYYILWRNPIDKINLQVDEPECGTNIEYEDESQFPKDKSMQPNVTITEGADKVSIKSEDGKEEVFWEVNGEHSPVIFKGKIVGGSEYLAGMTFDISFKYYVDKDSTKILVNNKTITVDEYSNQTLEVHAPITAVHDWQTPEIVKPTLVTEGYERRFCKHVATCHGSEITKTFPKVTYSNTSGDGNVWTKGSNTTSDFTFIRSYEDTSFSFFKGIQVDGKSVDASNYKATKGSTVVKLNAAYLEKLTVGGHTITAIFSEMIPDRGPVEATASARFTVKEKSSGGGDSSKPSKPIDNVVTCQMAGYPSNYVWNEAAKACQAGYLDAAGKFHPYGRSIPNTYDPNTVIFAYLAMIAMTIACFCGVKLLHEDWEV